MSEEQESVFFFVTKDVTFNETKSTDKFAVIEATVMELEKPSTPPNNRIYQFEEGSQIAKSLVGKPVYYGVDMFGKHENPLVKKNSIKEPVGFVESAIVVGNKIRAIIKIISSSIIECLKSGTKYLFSVGGNAIGETIKKIGERVVHVLHGARCNHLQIVDVGTIVGFPNAKMEKLIEIQETVMICENGMCQCVGQKGKPKISDETFVYNNGEDVEWEEDG